MALASYYAMSGEHENALELGRRVMRLAMKLNDPLHIAISHWLPGFTLLYLGEFLEARQYLEQVIAYYNHRKPRSLAFQFGFDPGVACLSWTAHALWYLGYPDRALKRAQEAHSLASGLDHTHTLAFALGVAKVKFHIFRREVQNAREPLRELIRLSKKEAFPHYLASGTFYRGYSQAHEGHVDEGIEQMRRGIAAFESVGMKGGRTSYFALLAGSYAMTEQPQEGKNVLAEAQTHLERSGERFWEAELDRLEGELLLTQGECEVEAEACFRRAIEVAQRQRAKSWELRATMSLARMWQKQGKKEEARQRMAEIYNWFTEGFDTPDLKDAKALLEELS
jgi:predicted ATPase